MAVTHKLIETVTVGSGGAASIDFTSIPQTYTDLVIVSSIRGGRTSAAVDNLLVGFNGAYTLVTNRNLYGDGASAVSGTNANWVGIVPSSIATASTFSNGIIYIPNYTSSSYKSFSADAVGEQNGTTAYQLLAAGLWSSTAAITSIGLKCEVTASFLQYSSASLYGIKNS
jgi:hypothetical protein